MEGKTCFSQNHQFYFSFHPQKRLPNLAQFVCLHSINILFFFYQTLFFFLIYLLYFHLETLQTKRFPPAPNIPLLWRVEHSVEFLPLQFDLNESFLVTKDLQIYHRSTTTSSELISKVEPTDCKTQEFILMLVLDNIRMTW